MYPAVMKAGANASILGHQYDIHSCHSRCKCVCIELDTLGTGALLVHRRFVLQYTE